MSPYQAMYMKPPPTIISYEHNNQDSHDLRDSLKALDALLNKLKQPLTQNKHFMSAILRLTH